MGGWKKILERLSEAGLYDLMVYGEDFNFYCEAIEDFEQQEVS